MRSILAAGAVTTCATAAGGNPLTGSEPLAGDFNSAWEAAKLAFAGDASEEETVAARARIIAEPSRDLEDVKLRARACLWRCGGNVKEAVGELTEESGATDRYVLQAIIGDLLALGGAASLSAGTPATSRSSCLTASYSTGATATARAASPALSRALKPRPDAYTATLSINRALPSHAAASARAAPLTCSIGASVVASTIDT